MFEDRPTTAEQARIADPDTIVRVYVGTPLGAPDRAGILANYRRACHAVRVLIDEGYAPVAPHLMYCLVLDEQVPWHRELGINLDMALMPGFDKVVLFTPDGTADTLSSGMKLDGARAAALDARRQSVYDRLDDLVPEQVRTLIADGLTVEFRAWPETPAGWSPSFLTPGGSWLRPADDAVPA